MTRTHLMLAPDYGGAPEPIDGSALAALPWDETSEAGDAEAMGAAVGGVLVEAGLQRHARRVHQQRPRCFRLRIAKALPAEVDVVREAIEETRHGCVPIAMRVSRYDSADLPAPLYRIVSALDEHTVTRRAGGVFSQVDLTLEEVARPLAVLAPEGGALNPPGGEPGDQTTDPTDPVEPPTSESGEALHFGGMVPGGLDGVPPGEAQ